jgi:hypothetical protein
LFFIGFLLTTRAIVQNLLRLYLRQVSCITPLFPQIEKHSAKAGKYVVSEAFLAGKLARYVYWDRKWKGEIKMISNFQDLLTSVDVLNTLHGGVSEAVISHSEQASGRVVRVRVPGIDRESLHVEIHNNELSIFYFIPIESMGKTIQMPQVVYKQVIPYFIERGGIRAVYEDPELIVNLPFNKLSEGSNQRLKID